MEQLELETAGIGGVNKTSSVTGSCLFDVEFGFGSRLIDDSTWTVGEITKPSLWGHRTPQPTR